MTTSENIITHNETSEQATTLNIRHRLSADFESSFFLNFNEFVIRTLQFDEGSQDSLVFSTDRNLMVMQFCLQGGGSFIDNCTQQTVILNTGDYALIYVPVGAFKFIPVIKGATLLTIFIDEAFFFEHLPQNYLTTTFEKINDFGSVFPKNMVVNSKLAAVLKEIKDCEFNLPLKKMYMKAKLLELLTLQLVQQENFKSVTLKSSQVQKMAKVRDLIDQDLSQSLSISILARLAGTNEQYLKKHFKLLYGQTVFGYMLSSKMLKAKEMLLEGENSITEIAEAVGYKHATHFTSAFKKFFGHLPRLLKTKLLIGGYFSFGMEFELLEMLIAI